MYLFYYFFINESNENFVICSLSWVRFSVFVVKREKKNLKNSYKKCKTEKMKKKKKYIDIHLKYTFKKNCFVI